MTTAAQTAAGPVDVELYETKGYLLVPGLLAPGEAADLRRECHDLVARLSTTRDTNAQWLSGKRAAAVEDVVVQHSHDMQYHSAAVSRLLVDDRFTSVAAALLGTENVELHHTKMFIKPPEKGGAFPMHQDQPFIPHETERILATIFFLDDAPVERGCVRVVPGSHRLGPLPHDGPEFHLSTEQWPIADATPIPAQAGDALFFSYLLIHGSGVNASDEPRTTLLFQVRDAANRPTVRTHESRGQGMILRGIAPDAGAVRVGPGYAGLPTPA